MGWVSSNDPMSGCHCCGRNEDVHIPRSASSSPQNDGCFRVKPCRSIMENEYLKAGEKLLHAIQFLFVISHKLHTNIHFCDIEPRRDQVFATTQEFQQFLTCEPMKSRFWPI